MKYPCGMIKDLLPLYVDEVAGDDSRRAVDEHLAECDSCREYLAAMQGGNVLPQKSVKSDSDKEDEIMDEMMGKSLKNVKTRIDRKTRRVAAGVLAAVVLVAVAYNLLFLTALKTIDPREVQVSAAVYPISEIPYDVFYNIHDDATGTVGENDNENDSVTISMRAFDTNSYDVTYSLNIPAMPDSEVQVTGDIIDAGGYVSVISFTSRHTLRNISWEIKDNTIYIDAFKTTILGSSTGNNSKTVTTLEFQQINKVVYLNGGTQTVLWENNQQ